MRESIRKFVEICAQTLPIAEPIYEFGSFQVHGQEHMADLRPIFPGKKYIGADMRDGTGVDVILDLHDIDLPDLSAGTAIALDTMEHVEYPHRAVEELHRILHDRGILIMTSVMNFPIHEHPYDYWRFTPEAFNSLLKPFRYSFVDFAGDATFPHTVVGIGAKYGISQSVLAEFRRQFRPWKAWARLHTWKEWTETPPRELLPQDKGPERFAKRVSPPFLVDAYKKIKRRG